jgi:hypothetical protein
MKVSSFSEVTSSAASSEFLRPASLFGERGRTSAQKDASGTLNATLVAVMLQVISIPILAQNLGPVSSATLTTSNMVRFVIQPPPQTVSDLLVLQSSDSPSGPWWIEPDFQRNLVAGGAYEFLTPHKLFYPQRYYRFSLFTSSASASATLPYIRLIAPNQNVLLGQSVTLLGANFNPAPSGNTVTFALPGQSWTAPVTAASTNFVVATVPTNLLASSTGTGTLYRVTATTSQGTGNGVGCAVLQCTQYCTTAFSLRPSQVYVVQPPGSGKQTLVVGGGVPPYHLVPQSTNDLATAVASLDGPVLTVTAQTNIPLGAVTVAVTDSSSTNFPQQASSYVTILTVPFSPGLGATFHTLLGGSAPGWTMYLTNSESSEGNLQLARVELQLQNLGIDVSALQPGQDIGLLKFFAPDTGSIYGFQQLSVTEVVPGRAKFDVIALAGGGVQTTAQGELIENPPAVVINVMNFPAASLVPQPLADELIFADGIFRLPAGAGQPFALTANLTSVSARDDAYLPQRQTITNSFTTTGLATNAPRIDRLVPIQGEVGRNVQLFGGGFDANLLNNSVTFTGAGGTRVAANLVLQTNDELVVTVPRDAVSGPVELAVAGQISNDFLFFVRFHPETALVFDRLTNTVPAALELWHQQPVDDGETAGEVPLQTVICTLDSGDIVVTNLAVNQQVGTAVLTSFYDGSQTTNFIIYAGQETNALQRYLFREVPDTSSSYTLAWFYYSEGTNGVTLQLGPGDTLFPFYAGGLYDFQFTTPIYRPPANDVAVRIDAVSQQWMSPPATEMHRIVNSIRPVH